MKNAFIPQTVPHIASRRRGQTLVEALVALTILTTGFVGIVTLLTKSFQLNRITSKDTQATYLASEGIELAKNIIDYDVYYGLAQSSSTNDWGCSFGLSTGSHADYQLYYDLQPSGCNTLSKINTLQPLYYHTDTGFYDYTGGANAVQSNFTREVTITAVTDYELDVKSKVSWGDSFLGNSVTLEDYFYDWHP